MIIITFYLSLFINLLTSDNPKLTLNISEFKSLRGELVIGIYNDEGVFLKDNKAFKNYRITVDKSSETLIIDNLPPGEYAITMYHDENSDKKCNLNFLGIPKEAYGFSNNFKPKFSAPAYKDCKFVLKNDMVMDILLRH